MAKKPKLEIDDNIAAVLKKVDKLERALDKTNSSTATAGRRSERAGKRGSKAFAEMTTAVGTVSAAIGAGFVKALQLASEQLKKTAAVGQESLGSLLSIISGAGDIGNFGMITKRLRNMVGRGPRLFMMKGRGEIYGAVKGAFPEAAPEEALGLTRGAMRAGLMHGDLAQTKSFAGVMAELRRVYGKDTKTGDLGDMSALLTQIAGKEAPQLDRTAFKGVRQLLSQGMSADETIGMLIASFQSKQGARGLSSYASFRAQGGRGTIAPSAKAMLEEYKGRDYAGMVAGARTGDLLERQVSAAWGDPDIRLFQEGRMAKTDVELIRYSNRRRALEREAELATAEADMMRASWSPARRWSALAFGELATSLKPDIMPEQGRFGSSVDEEAVARGVERGLSRSGVGKPSLGPAGVPVDEAERALEF